MSHTVEGCLAAEAASESSPLLNPAPSSAPVPPRAPRRNSPDPRFESTDAYELSRLASEIAPPFGDDEADE